MVKISELNGTPRCNVYRLGSFLTFVDAWVKLHKSCFSQSQVLFFIFEGWPKASDLQLNLSVNEGRKKVSSRYNKPQ